MLKIWQMIGPTCGRLLPCRPTPRISGSGTPNFATCLAQTCRTTGCRSTQPSRNKCSKLRELRAWTVGRTTSRGSSLSNFPGCARKLTGSYARRPMSALCRRTSSSYSGAGERSASPSGKRTRLGLLLWAASSREPGAVVACRPIQPTSTTNGVVDRAPRS